MGKWDVFFVIPVVFLLALFLSTNLFSAQIDTDTQSLKPSNPQSKVQNLSSVSSGDPKSAFPTPQSKKAEFIQKTAKLQIPFVANNGQVDAQVKFYANTFGGTVFVTKNGEIVYSLPNNEKANTRGRESENRCEKSGLNPKPVVSNAEPSAIQNTSSTVIGDPKSGVVLRELLVGGNISEIKGEEKSVTNVNYFKGNDPSQWKTDISTFEAVSLGEVYNGIELRLKAYGNNVEKLFCVKPDANPNQIRVNLSGAKGLWVNDEGELEVETELGHVKFTKPVAYQEIDGKRVYVDAEYCIEKPDAGSEKQEDGSRKREARSKKTEARSERQEARNQRQEAIGKRLAGSREKGMGRKGTYLAYNLQLPTSNSQLSTKNSSPATRHSSLVYGFTVASYDKSHDIIIDPLLASTFLGGSYGGNVYSIVVNSSGNIYVAGSTQSSDFPTTTGAYDTSYNDDGPDDVFISELSGDLTNLIASTYLGGSSADYGRSIAIDSGGNIYVAGPTQSTDFPTTKGAYNTSYADKSSSTDIFLTKLNSDLTSLITSTYLGGSSSDSSYCITLDSDGNLYTAGSTDSTDFPLSTGAYDNNGGGNSNGLDVFVAKLDGNLTNLLASTSLLQGGYKKGLR